jgi:hypothetical protein
MPPYRRVRMVGLDSYRPLIGWVSLSTGERNQDVEKLREVTTGDLGLRVESVLYLVAGIMLTAWSALSPTGCRVPGSFVRSGPSSWGGRRCSSGGSGGCGRTTSPWSGTAPQREAILL